MVSISSNSTFDNIGMVRYFVGIQIPAQKMKLLLVEDDLTLGRVVRRALERSGFQVTFVHSGDAALAVLAGEDFDVLLSDVHMPEMDGLEMCRRISPSMLARTVLYSGEPEGVVPPKGVPMMAKPVDIQQLRAVLQQRACPTG